MKNEVEKSIMKRIKYEQGDYLKSDLKYNIFCKTKFQYFIS